MLLEARNRTYVYADGEVVTIDDSHVNPYFSRKAEVIKWAVFMALFFAFLLYIVFGHLHATRRLKGGKAPLKYHRWLLSRQQRAIHEPEYRNPMPYYGVYRPQWGPYRPDEYHMQNFAPPQYDPSQPLPPNYPTPEGASKVAPSQQHQPDPAGRPPAAGTANAAPPGAPPPAVTSNRKGAGGENPFRD